MLLRRKLNNKHHLLPASTEVQMTICRHSTETDDQLRARIKAVENHEHRMKLRYLLNKLGLKSAREAFYVDFRTMPIFPPGRY
jgi:hypothetical protein